MIASVMLFRMRGHICRRGSSLWRYDG